MTRALNGMKWLGTTLVRAARELIEDKAPRLAASLSYYTVFSLPPLLVILIGIAGIAFGADAVREQMVTQLGGLIGQEAAVLLGDAVQDSERTGSGVAVVLGTATLLLGASGVVGQLTDSLNTIWEVEPPKGGGILKFIRSRFLSLAAVLGGGFLLLVSLAVSAGIAALVDTFSRFEVLVPLLATLDLAASFLVITLVFALIFKFLPDIEVAWSDVWFGAAITSALFVVGKFAIGFYLGTSDVGSAYGAAGSLIIILVWIYYSSLILFYGAEVTQVWSRRKRGVPGEVRVTVTPPIQPTRVQSVVFTSRLARMEPPPSGLLSAMALPRDASSARGSVSWA